MLDSCTDDMYTYIYIYTTISGISAELFWSSSMLAYDCDTPIPSKSPSCGLQNSLPFQVILQTAIYLYCRVQLDLLHHLKKRGGTSGHGRSQVATDFSNPKPIWPLNSFTSIAPSENQ